MHMDRQGNAIYDEDEIDPQVTALILKTEELEMVRLGHAIDFLKAFNARPNILAGPAVKRVIRAALRLAERSFAAGLDDDTED